MQDENIKRYTLKQIKEKHAAGDYWPTKPDAPEYEVEDDFWDNAHIVLPNGAKIPLSLRVDPDVVEWFKATGKGYLTRMNAVLRAYVEAQKNKTK
jgi:uncharacterized protein (DUF4415 family)